MTLSSDESISRRAHEPGAPLRQRDLLAALAWAIGLALCFFAVYGGCIWITFLRDRHNPASVGISFFGWERSIPFVPWMIVPYSSEDIFFFFAPFFCVNRHEMLVHGRRVFAALALAAICFLLFPLKMGPEFVRPPVGGLYGALFDFLGGFDRPYNLVPSLHVAWWPLLMAVYGRRVGTTARLLLHGWFILIVISTLFTWQHHLIDLIGGVVLGIFCLQLFPNARVVLSNATHHDGTP